MTIIHMVGKALTLSTNRMRKDVVREKGNAS